MTVLAAQILKGMYSQARALGDKAINSDFTFEIAGHEGLYLLCKQAPHAMISPAGEIEIYLPNGQKAWQPQTVETALQGAISFYETTAGSVQKFLREIVAIGGIFDGRLYEGTPDRYTRYHPYLNCFFQVDQGDRDWENRSQVLAISGTLFYHYFGDPVEGNA